MDSLPVLTAQVAEETFDEQDLCQEAEAGRRHFEGAWRRRAGEGGHHAVDNVGNQSQQPQGQQEDEPRLPLEAHEAPRRTPLELVLCLADDASQPVFAPTSHLDPCGKTHMMSKKILAAAEIPERLSG